MNLGDTLMLDTGPKICLVQVPTPPFPHNTLRSQVMEVEIFHTIKLKDLW